MHKENIKIKIASENLHASFYKSENKITTKIKTNKITKYEMT